MIEAYSRRCNFVRTQFVILLIFSPAFGIETNKTTALQARNVDDKIQDLGARPEGSPWKESIFYPSVIHDDVGHDLKMGFDVKEQLGGEKFQASLNVLGHGIDQVATRTKFTISYQLIYGEQLLCELMESDHYPVWRSSSRPRRGRVSTTTEEERDSCRAELYTGRVEDAKLVELCDIQRLSTFLPSKSTTVTFAHNLLPNQVYEFNVTASISGKYHLQEKRTTLCTGEAKPVAPPVADSSSFEYRFNDDADRVGNETVAIFWRLVSRILGGSNAYHYQLECLHSGESNATWSRNLSSNIGTFVISKRRNESVDCRLATGNHMNTSDEASRIFVPTRNNLTEMVGKFRLVAFKESSRRFRLEWSPLMVRAENGSRLSFAVLPRGAANRPTGSGHLLIYWCTKTVDGDCLHFDRVVGGLDVSLSSYLIDMTEYYVLENQGNNPKFGLAYEQNSSLSTGIMWSKCGVIRESTVTSEPMRLDGTFVEASNGTLLRISWPSPTCDPIRFKISAYELHHCRIANTEACSSPWGLPVFANASEFDFNRSDVSCTLTTFPNYVAENEFLLERHPDFKYFVRVRYALSNGTSEWSNVVAFPPVTECQISVWLYVLIPILILLGATSYRHGTIWYKYSRTIFHRFKTARAKVNSNLDMSCKLESELLARKYCVNRETNDSCGDLPVNVLDYMDSLGAHRAGGHERNCGANKSFDYIPRQLIENENTTPENFSDSTRDVSKGENSSEPDDISMSSQSSFLNNILNERLDNDSSSESNN